MFQLNLFWTLTQCRLLPGAVSIVTLDFERDLVPIMSRVLAKRQLLPDYVDEPAPLLASIKVALMLWLFFDKECALNEQTVRERIDQIGRQQASCTRSIVMGLQSI